MIGHDSINFDAVGSVAAEDRRVPQQLEIDEQSFALNGVRLSFRDPGVERRFIHETFIQSINFIRAYLIAGTALYIAFGLLDAFVGGTAATSMLLIRYAVVCPILIAIFIMTFFPIFVRIGQLALSTAMLSSGIGVVVMTAIMPAPFNSQYYAGLIMVVIYCGSLIRLKFYYGVLITLFLILMYQVSARLINPISMTMYVSNNFFLVMACTVGLFSSYIQELYIRKTYARGKIIELKNHVTVVLLRESDKANKSKAEFLANMSHELRTPLNAVIGFSEILHKQLFGPLGNEKYIEYVADIHQSGANLLSVVNQVLDLVDAEAGKVELREQDVDLSTLLDDCAEVCQFRADERGVRLILPTESHVRALVDEKLFRQAILNLLSNAVKFTPSGGEVRLTISGNPDDGILVQVIDTGIGISRENIERVLRPFEQIESSYARSNGGIGLGLPYAKKLVELHRGKLTIDSDVGRGTTVSVTLHPDRLVAVAPTLKKAS